MTTTLVVPHQPTVALPLSVACPSHESTTSQRTTNATTTSISTATKKVRFNEVKNAIYQSPSSSTDLDELWYTDKELARCRHQLADLLRTVRVQQKHETLMSFLPPPQDKVKSSSSSSWAHTLLRLYQTCGALQPTSDTLEVPGHSLAIPDVTLVGMERWTVPHIIRDLQDRRRHLNQLVKLLPGHSPDKLAKSCRVVSQSSFAFARYVAEAVASGSE